MAASAHRQLVIFDLCDTLYGVNTTVGFLRYYADVTANQRIDRRLNRWLNRASPLFYLGAVAHRILGYDLARHRLIASLTGAPRHGLEIAARDYARDALPPLANVELHEQLSAHSAAGDRVVLVSSSLDLVVAPIADMLGVEFRASVLAFAGDSCAGRLERDLTGDKADVARDLLATRPGPLKVYTDNRSDASLVAMADSATIVIPKGSADDRWAGEDCDYVRL